MQYILTQQEYETLKREERLHTEAQIADLQKVCTLAAQHIPIVAEWGADKTPRPWGCILVPSEHDPGCCDLCPAQKVCPHPEKEWSQ